MNTQKHRHTRANSLWVCVVLLLGLMAPGLDAFAQQMSPLTFDQILGLIEADVDTTEIKKQIVKFGVDFELTTQQKIDLARVGASNELLRVIEENHIEEENPCEEVPPSQLESVESELDKANIILSEIPGRVEQVRQWLRSDRAYQTLAQRCLCLTIPTGKRVIDTIPLEVINVKYKEVYSERVDTTFNPMDYLTWDKYNNEEHLKLAIFKTWKERHSDSPQSDFDEIVESIE